MVLEAPSFGQAPIEGECDPQNGPVGRFPEHERRRLLAMPGIGELVICRLEQVGVHSVLDLRTRGIEALVEHICGLGGNPAWRNRRRALARALQGLESPAP